MNRSARHASYRMPSLLAGLAACWLFLVHVAAPWVIRLAHAERGPAWLSATLAGRAQYPVERYLSYWSGTAWKLDLVALAALGVFLARRPLLRAWDSVVRAEPRIGSAELLGTALIFGLATGALQGLHVFVRTMFQPLSDAVLDKSPEALWMAPLGESAVMFGLGLTVVLVTRAWRKPVSLRLAATVFGAVAVYGLLRSARLGIGIWPSRLLALGVAAQTGAWVASHAEALNRNRSTILAAGVLWIVGAALLLSGGRAVREWWVVRGLPDADRGDPDIVLLILDTVRAHNLGLYGHEHANTPRLEEIARESTVFDAAVSVTSWTLPAHASMLTGRFPWEMSLSRTTPLGESPATLAEVLSQRGYATGGFVANMFFAGRSAGMARGFARFTDAPVSPAMVVRNSWLADRVAGRVRQALGRETDVTRDARTIGDDFLGWAARRSDRPYFAMLNFMDAHAPYEAPDSIVERFAEQGARNTPLDGTVYAPEELAEFRSTYDAGIAFIDQEIGRIADTLRARGRLDRTILVVTSDHGEQFGERDPGLTGHGNSLYASSIVVPLLVRYPAFVPAGLRVPGTVSTRRIPATVMDLRGADTTSPFPGFSLMKELEDRANPDVPTGTPVLSFLRQRAARLSPNQPEEAFPLVSSMTERWHYIRDDAGGEELYDWVADPWETANRIADPELGDVLDRLRNAATVPLSSPHRRGTS